MVVRGIERRTMSAASPLSTATTVEAVSTREVVAVHLLDATLIWRHCWPQRVEPARARHADSRAVDKRVRPRAIAANCRNCPYVPYLAAVLFTRATLPAASIRHEFRAGSHDARRCLEIGWKAIATSCAPAEGGLLAP